MFTVEQIEGLKWCQVVPQQTPQGLYRVQIEWALDHYRVTVIDLSSNHVICIGRAWYPYTAIRRANWYLRHYTKLEPREAL